MRDIKELHEAIYSFFNEYLMLAGRMGKILAVVDQRVLIIGERGGFWLGEYTAFSDRETGVLQEISILLLRPATLCTGQGG